ncbi:MAG: hypothetical protein U0R70_11490 [Solirubrobacteraceae bacterium]
MAGSVPAQAAPSASPGAASCKALSSKGLKAVLRRVMDRNTTQRTPLPSKVRFGRCGSRYYAAAWFNFPGTGFTDQPEKFTRQRGRPWRLIGDTGGPILDGIPRALRNAWGLR